MFVARFRVEGTNELFGNLRRNVGGSNLIVSLEIKRMMTGIRIMLTVYIYFSECEILMYVCCVS